MRKSKKKIEEEQNKELRKTGFYYSFLTVVLLFCLIQIGFSAILNITKLVSHKAKILTLQKILTEAENKNKELKYNLNEFSSSQNLEGIARNSLKMAGEDEVLVIINTKTEDTETKENNKYKFKNKFKYKKRGNNAQ